MKDESVPFVVMKFFAAGVGAHINLGCRIQRPNRLSSHRNEEVAAPGKAAAAP